MNSRCLSMMEMLFISCTYVESSTRLCMKETWVSKYSSSLLIWSTICWINLQIQDQTKRKFWIKLKCWKGRCCWDDFIFITITQHNKNGVSYFNRKSSNDRLFIYKYVKLFDNNQRSKDGNNLCSKKSSKILLPSQSLK
jgi:hypothetical protein